MNVLFDTPSASFPELNLRRDRATHVLVFNPEPFEKLLVQNGISPQKLEELSEESLQELILSWYVSHRGRGGHCNAEAASSIRELLSPTSPYKLAVRTMPVERRKSQRTSTDQVKKKMQRGAEPRGLVVYLRSLGRWLLGSEESLQRPHEYAGYTVPAGEAIHLRPRRQRQRY